MPAPLFILMLIALVVALYVAIAFASWFKMRGMRLVECPENDQIAAVEVDATHAAMSAVLEREELRLQSCSLWPERGQCSQACMQQIATAPRATLATSVLKRFFAGSVCALCQRTIRSVDVGAQKPGLLNPTTHELLTWEAISTRDVTDVFRTHVPVCSNCQVLETFRRQHPDSVVDRHRTIETFERG